MGRIAGLAMAVILGAAAADAAAAEAVTNGSRVRVDSSTAEGRITGTLRGVRADRLRVQVDGRDWATEVPFGSVRQLWVSRGTTNKAVLGAVLGALAGAAAGYALFDDEDADPEAGDGRGLNVVFGAAAGAAAGGLLGSAIKGERWQAVDLSAVRTSALPPPPLKVTLRF